MSDDLAKRSTADLFGGCVVRALHHGRRTTRFAIFDGFT